MAQSMKIHKLASIVLLAYEFLALTLGTTLELSIHRKYSNHIYAKSRIFCLQSLYLNIHFVVQS